MRKLVMFNLVSIDGYFADEQGGLDWQVTDPEFDRWAAETIDEFDSVLLGRVTYDLFAGFWPGALTDPKTNPDDLIVAKALNDWTKFVFSKSLKNPAWQKTVVMRDIDPEEIKKLKEQSGKNIAMYGSGSVVRQMSEFGLIDEYRFMVNPIVLVKGKRLFEDIGSIKLKLLYSRTFSSGNALLKYKPSGR